MNLQALRDALLAVHPRVFHFRASRETPPYIVWAEDGQGDSQSLNNRMEYQAIQGTVDLFTLTEYDPLVGRIQGALSDAGIAWRLNSIQYEDDTKLIHYEWVFEVDGV